jgi:hypothetical protein
VQAYEKGLAKYIALYPNEPQPLITCNCTTYFVPHHFYEVEHLQYQIEEIKKNNLQRTNGSRSSDYSNWTNL